MLKTLQEIGLTEGEAKTYLAMLSLGTTTVGPIEKTSGISYSKIYEVLQRLIDKGIVSFILKEKTKYFQAISPNLLHKFLDIQKLEIEKNREKLNTIIPELEKHTKFFEEKQEAEIFIGLKGLRTANEKLFSQAAKNEIALFFYVYNQQYADIVDEFYSKIAPTYKSQGIKFKGIGSKEWLNSNYVKKTSSFIDARSVDFPLPGTIDIYKDMILQVVWKEKPVSILIHSKEVAEDYRTYFNEVWKIAKSKKFNEGKYDR